MVELRKKDRTLDRVFAALADGSRRKMLERLRKRPLTISELARPFSMSFAGVAKHIDVLTEAGLVRKIRDSEDGRSFRLELQDRTLSEASRWMTYHRDFWTKKLDRLELFLQEQDHVPERTKGRKKN
ncbi:ArsR family transcriptional regulator [Leptospira gomenensis]|uniref:ArsR family transcriptional regulator n=1 Tax=Leptospira gomenensis TaxID=2484974 RepID=A0A5F1Z075_9LEPT|nr:metalloregulator ArsR/SmtB family transcription factor [Leptospira gomenensis]TGK30996.1 ArsR family transcriptional regulator [Leptospira gomenensis]TGK35619.1 ArsR family transcriptional regulator [Leptospira gomenensis]TGK45284.1 ArsR family transcriptional regulator [Leptospira gomenensis]TGK66198.1 ArsR family transcriptional regulator [Leptospira gomenensis]